jgi:hypothetical protein
MPPRPTNTTAHIAARRRTVTQLPRLALTLGALGFVAFGASLLVAPTLLAVVDLGMPTAAARSDVRAVYGGLELGVGLFLAACARRPAWHRPGLVAQSLALGGAVAGRLASFTADGVPNTFSFAFFALEAAGAVLALAALRTTPDD